MSTPPATLHVVQPDETPPPVDERREFVLMLERLVAALVRVEARLDAPVSLEQANELIAGLTQRLHAVEHELAMARKHECP